MKRIVVKASSTEAKQNQKSANKMMRDVYSHLKQAFDLLAEIPEEGPHGEFSTYLYGELNVLVKETGHELNMF